LAAVLLGANLGHRYLWQDEAATAVLANRMFRYGKPLAYDGRNLITMDVTTVSDEPQLGAATSSAEAGVNYFVERGDFKADTTWIGQPWGQFVAAGMSLKLLGQSTLAARLPFALAGLTTAVLLYLFARSAVDDWLVGAVAAALLLGNVYWIEHMRQCRYYALSSLCLLLVVILFWRWQHGARWGALAFVIVGWCFFQSDYGSFFPVSGVLATWAMVSNIKRLRQTLLTFAALGAGVAPFVVYYELWGRGQASSVHCGELAVQLLALLNSYQFPLLLAAASIAYFVLMHDESKRPERELLLLCLTLAAAQLAWLAFVAPYPFYRYMVNLTPLSVLAMSITLVGICRRWVHGSEWRVAVVCCVALLLLLSTRAAALPGQWGLQPFSSRGELSKNGGAGLIRDEWELLWSDVRGTGPDPNRAAVEYLRGRVHPDDEILVTYEDIPLMFYLPNRIRGGVGMFRVNDGPAPRFVVFRKYVPFLPFQQAIFRTALGGRDWLTADTEVIALPTGNNPDPTENHVAMLRAMTRDGRTDTTKILERVE
jgi:4-amino-4-deoxy-L-arabinose transferase-like glycosyltransferase